MVEDKCIEHWSCPADFSLPLHGATSYYPLNPKILPRVKHTHNIILYHLVWLGNVFFGGKHEQLYASEVKE